MKLTKTETKKEWLSANEWLKDNVKEEDYYFDCFRSDEKGYSVDYYNKTECGTKGCYLGWLVFVPSNIFSINKTVEEIDRFPKVFLDFRKYGKELKEHYTLPYNMLSYLDVCLLNGQCETPKSLEEIINTINNYFENL